MTQDEIKAIKVILCFVAFGFVCGFIIGGE